jgi:hypothetical protein
MFPLSAELYLLICGPFETIIIAQTEWHENRIHSNAIDHTKQV